MLLCKVSTCCPLHARAHHHMVHILVGLLVNIRMHERTSKSAIYDESCKVLWAGWHTRRRYSRTRAEGRSGQSQGSYSLLKKVKFIASAISCKDCLVRSRRPLPSVFMDSNLRIEVSGCLIRLLSKTTTIPVCGSDLHAYQAPVSVYATQEPNYVTGETTPVTLGHEWGPELLVKKLKHQSLDFPAQLLSLVQELTQKDGLSVRTSWCESAIWFEIWGSELPGTREPILSCRKEDCFPCSEGHHNICPHFAFIVSIF